MEPHATYEAMVQFIKDEGTGREQLLHFLEVKGIGANEVQGDDKDDV